MKLYYTLCGYRKLSFSLEDSADVLNLCMKYRYPYRDMRTDGETVSFVCTLLCASRIRSRCAERNIEIVLGDASGFPSLLMKLFSHSGLVLGALLATVVVLISGNYVWDIRVTGNERFTDTEIKRMLEECNFSVGVSLKGFDADKTELDVLMANTSLAWVSVNMRGTVAYVEVREKIVTEPQLQETAPANVIAKHSGRIVELVAYNGVPTVKVGDEVREGELLISGAYGENAPYLRVTRAAGYALARTVRTFSVEIPYAHTEKVYSEDKKSEIFMIFFKKNIKVFGNSGNLGTSCDKIEEEKKITLFGDSLPVSFCVNSYLPYETKTAQYSPEQARELALAELEVLLETELEGAEILLRRDSFSPSDSGVRVECEIICIENIALTREFEMKYN